MTATELGNRPAFPTEQVVSGYGTTMLVGGMTYRQKLVETAMLGLLTQKYDHGMRMYDGWRAEFANEACRFADAILAREAQEAGDARG